MVGVSTVDIRHCCQNSSVIVGRAPIRSPVVFIKQKVDAFVATGRFVAAEVNNVGVRSGCRHRKSISSAAASSISSSKDRSTALGCAGNTRTREECVLCGNLLAHDDNLVPSAESPSPTAVLRRPAASTKASWLPQTK